MRQWLNHHQYKDHYSMKIALYCNDGSPLNVLPAHIDDKGVGGAELSMLTWAETMSLRGHEVHIYNRTDDQTITTEAGTVFFPQSAFQPLNATDVYIAYRSPNPYLRQIQARVKLHWSMDQYTIGHFGRDVFPLVDKVVCISPFHRDYHIRTYGVDADKVTYIDLGVRSDIDGTKADERIPGRCIISSVQDRGLHILRPLWDRIVQAVPHASLVITGDYRLWGNLTANNGRHRAQWLNASNVVFLGKIPRQNYVDELRASVLMPYPCIFDELFCVSVAEAQRAGVWTITPDIGALATTNTCDVIPGQATNAAWQNQFVDRVVDILEMGSDSPVPDHQERFDWNTICEQWEALCG
jgi:glycosyltransferase involved in cell wall biosynthesis